MITMVCCYALTALIPGKSVPVIPLYKNVPHVVVSKEIVTDVEMAIVPVSNP